jgi:alpha-tubulin suppressor-like RCC1 family protein
MVLGDNRYGQLGFSLSSVVKVPKSLTFGIKIDKIDCGIEHTLLYAEFTNSLYAMGSNRFG